MDTYLQVKRRYDISTHRVRQKQQPEWLDLNYKPPPWFELQGRICAYASDAVVAAYELAHTSDNEVSNLWIKWRTLADEAQRTAKAGDIATARAGIDALKTAAEAIQVALKDAEEKDQALIKLIRSELRLRPSQMTPARTLRLSWYGVMGPPDPPQGP